MKKLFLILFSAIAGITVAPEILATAESGELAGVDFNAVETVEVKAAEPVEEASAETALAANDTVAEPIAQANVAVAVTQAIPATVNYTVTHNVGSRQEYIDLAHNLSYSDIYKYQKLVYGHNSSSLLGNLSARYVGEEITITEGGVTKSYRVADVQYYQMINGQLNGDKSLMTSIANTALGHSLALLTCAGTPDGNGGASHRLVVFVDEM